MPFGLRNTGQSFQRFMDEVLSWLDFAFCYLDDIHWLLQHRGASTSSSPGSSVTSRATTSPPKGCCRSSSMCRQYRTSLFLGGSSRQQQTCSFPSWTRCGRTRAGFGRLPCSTASSWSRRLWRRWPPSPTKTRGRTSAWRWMRVTHTSGRSYSSGSPAAAAAAAAGDRYPSSKKLDTAQLTYSAFDRELLAAYLSVRHFRYVLDGRKFHIMSDHKPLTQALHRVFDPWTPRVQRQLSYLAELTSDIRHVPGKANVVADALSRQLPSEVASVKEPPGSLATARQGGKPNSSPPSVPEWPAASARPPLSSVVSVKEPAGSLTTAWHRGKPNPS